MAISCDPDTLANASRCYCGITGSQAEAVKIYLLAVAAGKDGLTPDELVAAASCYTCIPPGMSKSVLIYLLCQIAESGEIIQQDCENLEGEGPP